jgi:hypothetical protein
LLRYLLETAFEEAEEMNSKAAKKITSPRGSLSPRDASILALLAQVPEGLDWSERMRKRLLGRLSDGAREIGDALVADEGSFRSLSDRAQETAGEIKRWAASFPK